MTRVGVTYTLQQQIPPKVSNPGEFLERQRALQGVYSEPSNELDSCTTRSIGKVSRPVATSSPSVSSITLPSIRLGRGHSVRLRAVCAITHSVVTAATSARPDIGLTDNGSIFLIELLGLEL